MRKTVAATVTFAITLAGMFSSKATVLAQASNKPQTSSSRLASGSPLIRNPDSSEISKELDAYLEKAVAEDACSSVVLVAKGWQPIFRKAYGMASQSNSTPNTVDTKFDLGSMNKMFTAVAIAQLAERDSMRLA